MAAVAQGSSAGCDLAHLSNDELVQGTRRLVGASNQVFAMLLAHLAEVEARGVHRERACSSLYTYCIYELRFSEDAAFRRVSAARLVKRFPVLYEAIASGELHLTGLLMLGPLLTAENQLEVLARAKHRTKKELTKLIRALAPLPDLPARIEPLGPAPARPASDRPSWEELVAGLSPPIRELGAGAAPRAWMSATLRGVGGVGRDAAESSGSEDDAAEASNDGQHATGSDSDGREESLSARGEPVEPALARSGVTPVSGPLRYGLQFSAEEEYVELVERAPALLSHAHTKSSLEEVHLRAMRLLVADLEKRRFAKVVRPRKPTLPGEVAAGEVAAGEVGNARRGRHIPAAARRSVFERDGARCTYVDGAADRCRETHQLELHHLEPFGKGGTHAAANLTLRCRAHNGLAAEQDFGRGRVERAKQSRRHEAFAAQKDSG